MDGDDDLAWTTQASWPLRWRHSIIRSHAVQKQMQRAQEAVGPSRPTQTATIAPAPDTRSGTLRLRGHHTDSRRVKWSKNTVDNEHLGRKSSKICCIYHKPKDFDESSSDSSSESDSQDTGDEHDLASQDLKRKIQMKKKKRAQEESCCDHAHGSSSSEEKVDEPVLPNAARNAYEKGVK